MRQPQQGKFTYTASAGLLPKEEMLEVTKKNQQLYVGLPAECTLQENRVALVPEAVARLVNNGHDVVVETNALAAGGIDHVNTYISYTLPANVENGAAASPWNFKVSSVDTVWRPGSSALYVELSAVTSMESLPNSIPNPSGVRNDSRS